MGTEESHVDELEQQAVVEVRGAHINADAHCRLGRLQVEIRGFDLAVGGAAEPEGQRRQLDPAGHRDLERSRRRVGLAGLRRETGFDDDVLLVRLEAEIDLLHHRVGQPEERVELQIALWRELRERHRIDREQGDQELGHDKVGIDKGGQLEGEVVEIDVAVLIEVGNLVIGQVVLDLAEHQHAQRLRDRHRAVAVDVQHVEGLGDSKKVVLLLDEPEPLAQRRVIVNPAETHGDVIQRQRLRQRRAHQDRLAVADDLGEEPRHVGLERGIIDQQLVQFVVQGVEAVANGVSDAHQRVIRAQQHPRLQRLEQHLARRPAWGRRQVAQRAVHRAPERVGGKTMIAQERVSHGTPLLIAMKRRTPGIRGAETTTRPGGAL